MSRILLPKRFEEIELSLSVEGHPHLLVQSGIVVTLYLSGELAPMCGGLASAIETYFSSVPRATMKSYGGHPRESRLGEER